MMYQTTIKFPTSMSGVGIHCGTMCKVTVHPAPVNTGIVFLVKGHEIPATIDNVTDTRLCTIIGHEHKVATVEHIMSALIGSGIDNVYVEVVGPEIPILDGSACEYFFALQSAGRDISEVPVIVGTLQEPVRVDVEDRYCMLMPSDEYELDYSFAYYPSQCLKDHPHASFSFTHGDYEHQLARARTFGMIGDHEKLRAMNCSLGASLDNVLVLDEKGPLNPAGMRFPNEPARHKILDAIGDLAFLGVRLRLKFVGYGSGHAMHNALVKKAIQCIQAL